MTVLAKGETCEASKGSDADGEHVGVRALASSWRLPGLHIDFIHDAMTLLVMFFSAVLFHNFLSEEGEEAKSVRSIWWEKVSFILASTGLT